MELDFKDVVQLSDLGSAALQKTLVESILEKDSTCGCGVHAKEVSKSCVLVGACCISIHESTSRTGSADDWDSESGQKDERSGASHIALADSRMILLGSACDAHSGSRTAQDVEVLAPSSSMEKEVVTDHEDSGQLLEVVSHHDWLGRALAQAKQSMDVLDAAEGLLPEFELNSDIQLLEASVEVTLKSLRVREVDGMHLRGELSSILQVIAKKFAKSSELGLAGVLGAELESLVRGRLVHDLEPSVVLKDIQDHSVNFPKELEPWRNDGSVSSVP